MATITHKGKIAYVGGNYGNDVISSRIYRFGEFLVVADTVPPVITARFADGAVVQQAQRLIFEVKDNFSGIKEYNAYIDGEWVPLEYSPTRRTLTYRFDPLHPIGGGEHVIVVMVTDNCSNKTIFKQTFIR